MYLEEYQFENRELVSLLELSGAPGYCSGFITRSSDGRELFKFELDSSSGRETLVLRRTSLNGDRMEALRGEAYHLRPVGISIDSITFTLFFDAIRREAPHIEDVKIYLASGEKLYFDPSGDPALLGCLIVRRIS